MMILHFFNKLIEIPIECLKIEWVCRLIRTHGEREHRDAGWGNENSRWDKEREEK